MTDRPTLLTIAGGRGADEAALHAELLAGMKALVERLESGETLKSFAFAATLADGSVATEYSGEDYFALVGAVRWLETRLLDAVER